MFQINEEKSSKSKKKGDWYPLLNCQSSKLNNLPFTWLFNLLCSKNNPHASLLKVVLIVNVCLASSRQIWQWWKWRGGKVNQIEEKIIRRSSVHVPDIRGQGQRQENQKERHVHEHAHSTFKWGQIADCLCCVFKQRQKRVMILTLKRKENRRRKRAKGKRRRYLTTHNSPSIKLHILVDTTLGLTAASSARRDRRRPRFSSTTWRSSSWSRRRRAWPSSAEWRETREAWTRASTLRTTSTWTTPRRSGSWCTSHRLPSCCEI